MIYTGFLGGATDVVSAFAGCDAETSLIFATMVTVFVMLFLYLPRKVVTFKGFMESFVEGFKKGAKTAEKEINKKFKSEKK